MLAAAARHLSVETFVVLSRVSRAIRRKNLKGGRVSNGDAEPDRKRERTDGRCCGVGRFG